MDLNGLLSGFENIVKTGTGAFKTVSDTVNISKKTEISDASGKAYARAPNNNQIYLLVGAGLVGVMILFLVVKK